MAEFEGNWELEQADNFEAYMTAAGVPENIRKNALGIKTKIEIGPFTGKSWLYKVTSGEMVRETTLTLGKEFPSKSVLGKDVKSTVTLEGNVMTELQKGGANDEMITREVSGDQLILTLKCNGVTSVHKFKRV